MCFSGTCIQRLSVICDRSTSKATNLKHLLGNDLAICWIFSLGAGLIAEINSGKGMVETTQSPEVSQWSPDLSYPTLAIFPPWPRVISDTFEPR